MMSSPNRERYIKTDLSIKRSNKCRKPQLNRVISRFEGVKDNTRKEAKSILLKSRPIRNFTDRNRNEDN